MTVHRFYEDLARWWPLISPVEEYRDECRELVKVLRDAAPEARTLLDLGCGGGHVAAHLKAHFRMTLTDLSEDMLAVSRALNPECEHVRGDMRTLRLQRAFDVVLAHDAIGYMVTEADLAAAIETASLHCRPGGIALFVPDDTAESFEPGTDVGGSDGPEGDGIRFLEWTFDPDPHDQRATTIYSFVWRDRDGSIGSAVDEHVGGVFPIATWRRLIEARGFSVEVLTERTDDERTPRTLFLARRAPDLSARGIMSP